MKLKNAIYLAEGNSKISGTNKAQDLILQLIYLFCKDFEQKSCQVVSALL
jgi:hypothetical protein